MEEAKQNGPNFLLLCLLWGSLWGLAEATGGHLLHWLHIPGLAGFLMFPVGFFFMVKAYMSTRRLSSVFIIALVAAHIKLLDLFIPSPSFFAVVNPAAAIICESLAVTAFLSWKSFPKLESKIISLWAMSLSWRIFYGLWVNLSGYLFPAQNFLDLGALHAVRFFILETLISGALIFYLFRIIDLKIKDAPEFLRKQPVFTALSVFLAAVFLELLI